MKNYTGAELEAACGRDWIEFEDLIDEQGKTEFVLARTAFHGGGEISRHRSLRAALSAERAEHNTHTGNRIVFGTRYFGNGCQCGTARVVTADKFDRLPVAENASSAYSLAR